MHRVSSALLYVPLKLINNVSINAVSMLRYDYVLYSGIEIHRLLAPFEVLPRILLPTGQYHPR